MKSFPDNLTASALFEIVKDVPREAWPTLRYDWNTHGPKSQKYWYDYDDYRVTVPTATHAFNGAMAAWLLSKPKTLLEIGNANGEVQIGVSTSAPALLEALAAACREGKS